MSDTPTTAEQVIREAMASWRGTYDPRPTIPAHIVAALRNSPDALADLNGGEWVQPTDAAGKVPVWFQKFRDAWPEKRKPSEIGRTQPLFIFVPREATDGND